MIPGRARPLRDARIGRSARGWPVDLLGGAFNPSSLSGLIGWFDASEESTITENAGAVEQWDDRSGNGKHATQITPANRPVVTSGGLAGKDVITFDGVSDFLASALAVNQPATVFVVVRNANTGVYTPVISSADAAARAETLLNDQNEFAAYGGSVIGGGTYAAATWYQIAALFDGASSKIFADGDEKASGDLGSQDSAQVRIGSSPDTP